MLNKPNAATEKPAKDESQVPPKRVARDTPETRMPAGMNPNFNFYVQWNANDIGGCCTGIGWGSYDYRSTPQFELNVRMPIKRIGVAAGGPSAMIKDGPNADLGFLYCQTTAAVADGGAMYAGGYLNKSGTTYPAGVYAFGIG